MRQTESDLFGLLWHEPLATEEPYEGNLHVRICGEGAGQPVPLPGNTGRVLSRERIEESLFGWDDALESNATEVHIHHLRKKLGKDLIVTIRGVGYMIPKAD